VNGDCGREPGRLFDHEGLLDHEGTAEGVGVELGRLGVVAPDGGEHRLIYAGTLLAASRRSVLAPRRLIPRLAGKRAGKLDC